MVKLTAGSDQTKLCLYSKVIFWEEKCIYLFNFFIKWNVKNQSHLNIRVFAL